MARSADQRPAWRRIAATGLVLVVAMCVQLAGLAEPVDRRLHDAFVRWSPGSGPPPALGVPDVAVVAIDPRSLRALPAWPWPRSLHAEAVERLAAAGARAIAFDIDFSSAASEPDEDARLAAAAQAVDRVVFATFSQHQLLDGGAELEIVNRPIPLLAQAATALGSVLVPIDPDGVVRHAPRESEIGGAAIPSLGRAALAVAVPASMQDRVDRLHGASDETRVDFRRIHPEIPTIAYVDLIEGHVDPGRLADRAVFIGATAAEFQDLWSTPAHPALPGVMIQAIAYRTAAAELEGQRVLSAAPAGAVLLGFLALAGVTRLRAPGGGGGRAALFAGTGLAWLGTGWALLWSLGLALPLAVGLGLVAVQYVLGLESLQRRIRARAEAQESSLAALARIGDAAVDVDEERPGAASSSAGLELAMELLGEVVSARGVVLLRAAPNGGLRRERLEWRPRGGEVGELVVSSENALAALEDRRPIERRDAFAAAAPVIYSPLYASGQAIGVLVVYGHPGQSMDRLQRRTIATVGAQLALTAQNLQLIERLRETFESSIAAVASAVEARDGYTDQHCRRLAAFSSLMGRRLGMDEEEIRAMELGALLHDVGKIGIPDAILNKPGRLSQDERQHMQRHPEIGAGIVAPVIGLSETTLHCVVHHHERWDGSGYPEGLDGEEIPLAARIVAIVDVWDALSSSRPYKQAFSQAEVRDLLTKGRGTQFDPDLVDLFFDVLHEQGEEMLELIARSSGQGSLA